jgi:hypothetical protein
MSIIYFSYGLTKSASSFVYQLQQEIINASTYNLVKLPQAIFGALGNPNYLERVTDENIKQILEWLPENSAVVIKTHSAPSPLLLKLLRDGKAFASVTYRDPRDIALSLVDHGARSRETGIPDFADFYKPLDSIDMIKMQVETRLSLWKENENCLFLNYKLIKNSPKVVIEKILQQISISNVDSNRITDKFEDKANVTLYNIGKSNRFLEDMTINEIDVFNETFEDFIEFCNL